LPEISLPRKRHNKIEETADKKEVKKESHKNHEQNQI
jgi:hypothetical protein